MMQLCGCGGGSGQLSPFGTLVSIVSVGTVGTVGTVWRSCWQLMRLTSWKRCDGCDSCDRGKRPLVGARLCDARVMRVAFLVRKVFTEWTVRVPRLTITMCGGDGEARV